MAKMTRLFLLFVVIFQAFSAQAKTVKDIFGRSVTVPDKVTRLAVWHS